MEMMLQTQNLCKYFRKQKAVNNVSLNIEKGQIYGLLGPNGAGKSTTLKMLTGMMKPTAGKIYFDGKLLDRKDLYTNRVEAQFADSSAVAIDCIAIEDEYGNTPAQRAELDWLLYNKPLEYAQLVLSGEMEHYLSLGCEHGRLED